jgi:hypothetical protein
MEGISDIRITGFDETRPPLILKAPYINLFFKLSHEAPKVWCEDFNHLVAKGAYPAKIEPAKGLFIETWVRKPDEIEAVLEELKQAITSCNEAYIARIQAEMSAAAAAAAGASADDEGEQGRLNRIIAGLNFD